MEIKMQAHVKIRALIGFAVTSLAGTLLHFAYEATGGAPWCAPFSAVNESTWEHVKLFFIPALLYALVENALAGARGGFWSVKLRSILLGAALIPLIFYTYNGVIGKSPAWVNIAIFFIATAASFIYEAKRSGAEKLLPPPKLSLLLLAALALLFVVFTFAPPHLAIFQDPVTGGYGIPS